MGPTRTHLTSICCPICSKSFGRQEHLNRHIWIHSDEKPFQCSQCDKRFARRDALSRHTAAHEEESHSLATGTWSRACIACAADRVRCSRGQPCRRCTMRMRSCQYPPGSQSNTGALDNGQLQGRRAVLDAVGPGHTTAAPGDGPSQIVSNNSNATASASFSPPLQGASGDPVTSLNWTGPVGGVDNLYDGSQLHQQGLGVSSVNWLSPEYDLTIDWDTLLSGYAVNNDPQAEMQGRSDPDHPEHSETRGASTDQDGPQHMRPGSVSESLQSRSVVGSVVSADSSEARYYVDGAGARAPFGGRIHSRNSVGAIATLQEATSDAGGSIQLSEQGASELTCSTAAYNGLVQAIEAQYPGSSDVLIAHLPSRSQMEAFVRHFFNTFHLIFPFVRKSSFANDTLTEPILLLAVAVVGSRYTRRLHGSQPGEGLFRLLDGILHRRRYGYSSDGGVETEDAPFEPGQRAEVQTRPGLHIIQAGILHVMCMMHSGKKIQVERAYIDRHYLVEACQSLKLLREGPQADDRGHLLQLPTHEAINKWIQRENRSRTGMMIWFLDSIFLYEFDLKPLIQLDDIDVILPSHDDVWESPNMATQGNRHFSETTLSGAMEIIYMQKRLPPHLGEFGMVLLINGIYRNTMNIMVREQTRLNSWTPTASAQHIPSPFAHNTVSPATPTSSRWRNSACDCLDVLHWPANSKAAQLSGSEHHTILHLHLARLIILTPTTHIQTFASESAQRDQSQTGSQGSKRYAVARQQVLEWVLQDRFKARLSIVHCGALYWHVRRYSCDSILEPYAIYIATLVLWAFCVSMEISEVTEVYSQDGEEEPEPSFLHLDRPLDDELVQTFVRLGHKMSAHIARVGDIHSRGATAKILREGISLLARDSAISSPAERGGTASEKAPCYTWGIEESFVALLRGLLHSTV